MFRRFFRNLVRGIGIAVLLGVAAGYIAINAAEHDPARWHRDPTRTRLSGMPNQYLAAPPGTTAGPAHTESRLHPVLPGDLLACFDAIARARPRVEVVAGDTGSLMITYVQRSAVIGFPDYITVKALARPGGSALAVFSRSRFGRSDFGVNRARVTAWLKESGARC